MARGETAVNHRYPLAGVGDEGLPGRVEGSENLNFGQLDEVAPSITSARWPATALRPRAVSGRSR